jgi:purine nucleosidase
MPMKIILDCDPGVDDALAMVFAVGSPELDLVGVTTVAGNVTLDKTTGNALRLRDFLGCEWPVTAGSPAPLLRPLSSAEHVHGEDGLGGARLPAPTTGPHAGRADDFIVDTVRASPGEITLVATGPLTNIALALEREPGLPGLVRDFVIMGGSASRGNVTPAAEFNIATDPEAAAAVFSAGWTVTMVGLDVTLRAIASRAVQARMGVLGRLADELLLPCLGGYADGGLDGTDGPPVHDVCAVAHAAQPTLLGCVPARVEVETTGRWTTGMTVTDFAAPRPACNALVATTIDVPAFWDTVIDAYSVAAAQLPSATV